MYLLYENVNAYTMSRVVNPKFDLMNLLKLRRRHCGTVHVCKGT